MSYTLLNTTYNPSPVRTMEHDVFELGCTNTNKDVCAVESYFQLEYTTASNKITNVDIICSFGIGGSRTSESSQIISNLNIDVHDLDVIPDDDAVFDGTYTDVVHSGNTYKRRFHTHVRPTDEINFDVSYDMLTKINESEVLNSNLNGTSALYSIDGKLRLIINHNKKLTLQYKKKISREIPTMSTNNDVGYGIGKDGDFQSVFITQLQNWRTNKLGTHVNKIGYLGVNNKYTSKTNADKIYTGDLSYVNYPNLDFDTSVLTAMSGVGNENDANTNCNSDPDCIGYVNKSSTYYKIPKNKINEIYYDITTPTAGSNSVYLKKLGLQLNENTHLSDISNSGANYMIDASNQEILEGRNYRANNLQIGTLENMLKPNYNALKSRRTTLNQSYQNLVNSFNKLTKNELSMLKEAGISVKNLKTLTTKYNDLYTNKEKSIKLKNMFETQKHDTSQLYNKSEYTMALTGIASIASLLYLFNYMKK